MRRNYGPPFDGWWEALQLDNAVTWFGRYVEAQLMETNKKGERVHELKDLLSDSTTTDTGMNTPDGMNWLAATFGVLKT